MDGWADPQSLAQPTAAPPANASAPPAYLEKYAGQIEGLQQQDQAAFDKSQAALAKPMSVLSKIQSQPIPQPPQQQKIPPAPGAETFQKDAMAWASAMAVLGAIGSRFARVPGEAALSAFAGAVKGWQEGNLQAYDNAAKQWEQNSKATVENNKQILEKYKQTLENRKMNIDEQMSQIQLISTQFHDKIMFDAAAAKNYTLVASIYEKNVKWTQEVDTKTKTLSEKTANDTRKAEMDARYWLSPEGAARLELPQGQPGSLTPTQQAKVKQLIEIYGGKGQTAPKEALKRFLEEHPDATGEQIQQFTQQGRPPRSAPAMALAKFIEEHPEATSQDITRFAGQFTGTMAGSRTANQYAVRVDQAAGEAEQFAQNALTASKKFPRGQFVPANKAIQAWQANTSNPDLAEFGFYNFSLANAYARAVNPTGVPRIDTANKFLEHLSTAQSPEVYERLVNAALVEIQGAQKSVSATKEHALEGGQTKLNTTGGASSGNDGWSGVEVVK